MLYGLFEFGKTIAIIILLNDYIRRNYPSRHSEILLNVGFNIIYLYSSLQISFRNGLQYIEKQNPTAAKIIRKLLKAKPKILDIEFVKDNQIVSSNSKQKYLTNNGVIVIPENDFILYSDTSETPYNIKILHPSSKWCLLNEKTYEYELSTIKFMLLEFIVGETTYKIDLSTSQYNFYIKDNILDRNFFLYYLRNIHIDAVIFEEDDIQLDEITIKIIDHNVDIKRISLTEDPSQCIKFDISSYEIIRQS